MPELPEVETFRKYFIRTSLNKNIKKVEVLEDKILSEIAKDLLVKKLRNRTFINAYRHGKYLFSRTNNHYYVVFHFGMTGRFKYLKTLDNIPRHSRLIIHFTDSALFYICMRKLGKVTVTDSKKKFITKKKLGPDALTISLDNFISLTANKRAMIKKVLMDQSFIAGIGNIYSDEILFQAKIHPGEKWDKLSKKDLRMLHESIIGVLTTATDNEASTERFPDNWLIPHRSKNGKCPECGRNIKMFKISNRSTYFCPSCQNKY